MKRLEIKTEKATLLVLELPKEAKHFEIAFDYKNYYLCWHDGQKDEYGFISGNHDQITLGECKYKKLGKVSEITEEDWKGIAKYIYDWGFINYSLKTQIRESLFKTATESGLSLLKANGVFINEKYQYDDNHLNMWSMESDWSNPHVFIKVD